jgi:hypothetical protein
MTVRSWRPPLVRPSRELAIHRRPSPPARHPLAAQPPAAVEIRWVSSRGWGSLPLAASVWARVARSAGGDRCLRSGAGGEIRWGRLPPSWSMPRGGCCHARRRHARHRPPPRRRLVGHRPPSQPTSPPPPSAAAKHEWGGSISRRRSNGADPSKAPPAAAPGQSGGKNRAGAH